MKIPENLKLVFLDIDGVLNIFTEPRDIIPEHVKLINQLAYMPGVMFVLSSDWRNNLDMEDLEHFSTFGFDGVFHGMTIKRANHKNTLNRGQEITQYLRENPCSNYVVIDDSNIEGHDGHFVQTRSNVGITQSGIDKAKKILVNVK
jgi:hypothetical protein